MGNELDNSRMLVCGHLLLQTRTDDLSMYISYFSPLGEIRRIYFGKFMISFPPRPMVGRRKVANMDTNKTPPEGLAGSKKPRLTAMERLTIEIELNEGKTPYAIAKKLGRPPEPAERLSL